MKTRKQLFSLFDADKKWKNDILIHVFFFCFPDYMDMLNEQIILEPLCFLYSNE